MTGAMLTGLSAVIELILNMLQLIVIASVVVSWVGADPRNQIVQVIYNLTEPIYRPLRTLTKNLPGPIDWAPFSVLLIIVFVQRGILPYIKILALQSNGMLGAP